MSIFDNIQPYFVDATIRERMHVRQARAKLADDLQDIKARIHAHKLQRREIEQLQDKLDAEAAREEQEERAAEARAISEAEDRDYRERVAFERAREIEYDRQEQVGIDRRRGLED